MTLASVSFRQEVVIRSTLNFEHAAKRLSTCTLSRLDSTKIHLHTVPSCVEKKVSWRCWVLAGAGSVFRH